MSTPLTCSMMDFCCCSYFPKQSYSEPLPPRTRTVLPYRKSHFFGNSRDKDSKKTLLSLSSFNVLLTSMYIGFNISVLNAPEKEIRKELGIESTFLWGVVVSAFNLGGLIGSSTAFALLQFSFLRQFLAFNTLLGIVASILQASSGSFTTFLASRFVVGFCCGGASVAVPLFLGETSPRALHGHAVMLHQLSVSFGIVVSQVLTKPLHPSGWRLLMMCSSSFGILQSVVYGLQNRCSVKTSERSLRGPRRRGGQFGTTHYYMQSNGHEDSKERKWCFLRDSQTAFVAFVLTVFQQSCGVNAITYYSTEFFRNRGYSEPLLATVFVCATNFLGLASSIVLLRIVSKKTLLLASTFGLTLATMFLTGFLALSSPTLQQDRIHEGFYVVSGIVVLVVFFEIGLGPLPALVTSELLGTANGMMALETMTIYSSLYWLTSFAVSISFPDLDYFLGDFCFLPFMMICFCVSIFVITVVPDLPRVFPDNSKSTQMDTALQTIRLHDEASWPLSSDEEPEDFLYRYPHGNRNLRTSPNQKRISSFDQLLGNSDNFQTRTLQCEAWVSQKFGQL